MADVIALPVVWIAHLRSLEGVDLAKQTLAPSCDRRNVVELRRVRELREFERCFEGYRCKEYP